MLGLDPGALALEPDFGGYGGGVLHGPWPPQPLPQSEVGAGQARRFAGAMPGPCLAIGGNATAGRAVARPWPQLLEGLSGRLVVNCAMPHAGVDAMLQNADLMAAARSAELCLIELPDAITLSNGFYAVHPRRNDRFLRADPLLQRLYPEIDFTPFSFIRHMVLTLWKTDAARFEEVRRVLAQRWSERMELLLERLEGRVVLIWWGNRRPLAPGDPLGLRPGAPQLVDRRMIEQLRRAADGLVEVVETERFRSSALPHDPAEDFAARLLPGPESHAAMAGQLLPWLRQPTL